MIYWCFIVSCYFKIFKSNEILEKLVKILYSRGEIRMDFFEWMFIVSAFIFFPSMMSALILMAKDLLERVKVLGWILGLLMIPIILVFINFLIVGKDSKLIIYLILIFSYLLAELLLDQVYKYDFRSRPATDIPYIILEYAACFSFVFGALSLDMALGWIVSFLFWAFLGVLVYYIIQRKKISSKK